jgi:subtilisin family serine protease
LKFQRISLVFLSLLITKPVAGQAYDSAPGVLLVKLKALPQSNQSVTKTKTIAKSLESLNNRFGVLEMRSLFRSADRPAGASTPAILSQIMKLTFAHEANMEEVMATYRQDPNVEYVQPNFIHRIDLTPNDSNFNHQTAMKILQAEAAWDLQLATPNVIVGVIDTGVDYNHEDLRSALWINGGEDLNRNGRVDSTDFNGVDDDGNGFVDDLRGWDFVDAPSFPDGGDFQTPDNDPLDQNGHGTSVAGLIGATGNNEIGVAGLAFGCRIMNLRAGTSLGFLEEDDVAAAMVYAVENGAQIINMSFGDEVASPLLRDVVQFAYSQNCVLVASAGNANTERIHFPSGFAETISVGATDFEDELAGFSNFGSSVDVVAPGVNLLTTTRGNQYGAFSGTSASAPLVSGLAALVLSKIPQLSNESVKGLITTTTDDVGETGWDRLFASGRANALKALKSPTFSVARLLHPNVDQGFSEGTIVVSGTAAGALLESFSIDIGAGETPAEWTEVFRQANRQVIDEQLTQMPTEDLTDGTHTLRLTVQNKAGTSVEDKVRFFIDRSPPLISNMRQTVMLDGKRQSFLVEFETDDVCDAAVHYRASGSTADFQIANLRFRSTNHRFHFTQDLARGELEYFVQATNGANLTSVENNGGNYSSADLTAPPVGGIPVAGVPLVLPPGFLLSKAADFDQDGSPEIILNEYDAGLNFGPMKILEVTVDHFEEMFATQEIFIPRDWGDSDGDGLPEILAGAGARSFIFEATAPNTFPTNIVWSDTNNVWASRFTDLDQDGRGELILRLDELFSVWEVVSDNEYAFVDSFPNPTEGTNFVGVPRSEVGDFDADGQLEILFGDFDGDVYIYENSGNDRYAFVWSERQPQLDTIDYLSQGDYDGDGVPEFTVGSHSDPTLNVESEFDSRYWLYRIYKSTGDNEFEPVWERAFFGFQSPADFDSGISSGDVDRDGRPEILINAFPDFYLVDYAASLSAYQVVWHAAPNRSNATLVADFNGNGVQEFFFNAGHDIVGHEVMADFTGPPTPAAFQARPLDTNLVELFWEPTSSPEGFRLYRGTDPQGVMFFAGVLSPPFLDTTVEAGADYWYRLTAVDSALSPPESLPTPLARVTPGPKPFVESAAFSPPTQVRVLFSKIMGPSVEDQNNFEVQGIGAPSSSIRHRSGKEVIITIPNGLSPGSHTLTARHVFDSAGAPIDTLRNAVTFEVTEQISAPYLVTATLSQQNQLLLEFNEPLDPISATQIENFTIEPNIDIDSAILDSQDPKFVRFQIDPKSPIGPFGIEYLITVRNVKNQTGISIKFGQGDTAALVFSSPDLSEVFAYPNPFRGDSDRDHVTIAGLTNEAIVRILDASGRLIRTIEENDGNGGAEWDLKDESGKSVASGIYLFYVEGEGKKAVGKLAVLK